MPKISVIVPNYNHAAFLERRIESILSQTCNDFELILLDDFSTDTSREILESYQSNPKVSHLVFNNRNSGSTFIQWQKGVALASGEYIWIAESDDWAEPTLLEKLTGLLDNHPTAGLAYCNSAFFLNDERYADSAAYKTTKFNTDRWHHDYFATGSYELEHAFLWDCTINNVSSVLMRRSILINLLPLDRPFVYSGDWYIYIRIASCSDIAYTYETLNNYRDHAANVSKRAGYNYMIELFYLFDWVLNARLSVEKKTIMKAFYACLSDLYASGLPWNIGKDFRMLRRINRQLLLLMWYKMFKRRIRKLLAEASRLLPGTKKTL
jgi:glycosyltransferase involved in cell wall biosynthesis